MTGPTKNKSKRSIILVKKSAWYQRAWRIGTFLMMQLRKWSTLLSQKVVAEFMTKTKKR